MALLAGEQISGGKVVDSDQRKSVFVAVGGTGTSDVALTGTIGTFSTMGSVIADSQEASGTVFNQTTAGQQSTSAHYFPVLVPAAITVYQLGWLNGATVSGNIDVGIYNSSLTKVVSTGSTPQATISVIQLVDIADTPLAAGLYYLACAWDNAIGIILRAGPSIVVQRACGVGQMTSGFPLPTTLTYTAPTQLYVPVLFGAIEGATF